MYFFTVTDPRDHPGTIQMLSRSRLAEPARVVFLTDKPDNLLYWDSLKKEKSGLSKSGPFTRRFQRRLANGKYRVEGTLDHAPVGRLVISVRSSLPSSNVGTTDDYRQFRITITCDKRIPAHHRGSCRR